jgi:hypothetical protein
MARPSELSNYTSAIDELIPAKYRGRVHLIVNGSFLLNAAGIDTQFPAKFLLNAGIDTQFPAKKSTELARLLAEMPPGARSYVEGNCSTWAGATLSGRSAARQSIVEVCRVQLLLHRRKHHSDIGRFHGTDSIALVIVVPRISWS